MLGGRGGDVIAVGPGHDVADAGKDDDRVSNSSGAGGIPDDEEPDIVLGGSGNDNISTVSFEDVSVNLVDSVFCGSGRQDEASVNRTDRTHGCERVDRN
jgi:Ca2+-binding RTX toxin-like protein